MPAQDLLSLVSNKAFLDKGAERSFHPADLPCIPSNRLVKTGYQRSHLPKEIVVSTMACENQDRRFLAKKLSLLRAVTVEQAGEMIKLMLQHKADKLTGPTLRELKVSIFLDTLKDCAVSQAAS